MHRADGSGTTFIFTNYLSKVSAEWKDKVGNNTSVKWPTGVAGKGNEGVAAYVQRLPGSIGYVEFAYALQNKMAHVRLRNREGVFVEPASAASVAGLLKMHRAGRLDSGQTVVCTLTGNGLKDVHWALEGAAEPVKVPVDAAVAARELGLV